MTVLELIVAVVLPLHTAALAVVLVMLFKLWRTVVPKLDRIHDDQVELTDALWGYAQELGREVSQLHKRDDRSMRDLVDTRVESANRDDSGTQYAAGFFETPGSVEGVARVQGCSGDVEGAVQVRGDLTHESSPLRSGPGAGTPDVPASTVDETVDATSAGVGESAGPGVPSSAGPALITIESCSSLGGSTRDVVFHAERADQSPCPRVRVEITLDPEREVAVGRLVAGLIDRLTGKVVGGDEELDLRGRGDENSMHSVIGFQSDPAGLTRADRLGHDLAPQQDRTRVRGDGEAVDRDRTVRGQHESSPYVVDAGAATPVDPALTVEETADTTPAGVGESAGPGVPSSAGPALTFPKVAAS